MAELASNQPGVRLRLHHGGTFKKDPETGGSRYVGGSVFNDTVPQSLKYHELCLRVNQKVGEPVSIKYQAPGEDLDAESLVSVTDDDDLQELVIEYLDALQRPGALGRATRTFRIHVYLQPALQFEIERTEGQYASEEDMEPSLCCHEANDDYSEQYSCEPSSDTEWQGTHSAQAAAAHSLANAQLFTAATSKMAGLHFAAGQSTQQRQTAAGGAPDAVVPNRWEAGLEDHALSNLNRSLQAYPVLPGGNVGYTADDFDVEDPYNEDGDEPAGIGAPKAFAAQHEAWDGAPTAARATAGTGENRFMNGPSLLLKVVCDLKGAPLSNRPLDRVRDAANGLPSHISAFGEGYTTGSAAAEPGNCGSLKLPSHISAFGDDSDMQQEDDPESMLQDAKDRGGQWHASHCITQEFGEGSRSNPGSQANGNANGMIDACPTPKVLLDSVQHVSRSQVTGTAKIGEGAFGEVSCADVFPYGTVAIKWLKKDRFAKYSESFQREAEVLARLNHPNIIRMFGLVTEPAGSPPSSAANSSMLKNEQYGGGHNQRMGGENIIAGIMMEYLRGGSLAQRFRTLAQSKRTLGMKERCRIALQASLGMSYLHDQSPAVIHFDLKPDNLLLEGEGDSVLVKVADFGLSKHKIQSYVTCHDLRGTLPYMAPELVRCPNQVCEKCDVWSMGVVMWEMFTLEVPFQELTAQDILRGLMQGSLVLRMQTPCEPEWQQLITACMESDPTTRPTFRQLAERLEELGKGIAAKEQRELLQAAAQQELLQQQQAVQQQAAAQQQAVAQQQAAVQAHLFAQQQQLPMQLTHQVFQQTQQQVQQQQQMALFYAAASAQHQQNQLQVQAQQQVQNLYADPTALVLAHEVIPHLYPGQVSHQLLMSPHHTPLGLHHQATPFPLHH